MDNGLPYGHIADLTKAQKALIDLLLDDPSGDDLADVLERTDADPADKVAVGKALGGGR